jgi:hypothetical protein
MPLRGIDFMSELKLRPTKIERGAAVVDSSDFPYCGWSYPHEGAQRKARASVSRPAVDEIRLMWSAIICMVMGAIQFFKAV